MSMLHNSLRVPSKNFFRPVLSQLIDILLSCIVDNTSVTDVTSVKISVTMSTTLLSLSLASFFAVSLTLLNQD